LTTGIQIELGAPLQDARPPTADAPTATTHSQQQLAQAPDSAPERSVNFTPPPSAQQGTDGVVG
jgi:hypothetical protein